MHILGSLALVVGAGIWQWAADGKARALANRKVHPPSSNAPAIEAAQHVQSVELELARRLDSLASLHSTLFGNSKSSTGPEVEVTTSQSMIANTTLSDRLSTLETLLKDVTSNVQTDDETRCELKLEDMQVISDACQSYQASADYEWRQMLDHILMEEELYVECANVASTLQVIDIPQYHQTIGTLRTSLQALTLAIDAEQQSIDRDTETAYDGYDEDADTATLDRHVFYVALAKIFSRERNLQEARRVRDGVAGALEEHMRMFGLDEAFSTLFFKTGSWSNYWVWVELRPGKVMEHLQRLVDAGLEIR